MNCEKSEVVPSQDFVYIRVHFQTLKGISLPPPNHLCSAFRSIHILLDHHSTPAWFWLSLLGTLGLLEELVPPGCLHIHPIHFYLWCQYALGVLPLLRLVSFNTPANASPLLVAVVSECGDKGTPWPISSLSDTVHGVQPGQLGCSLCELPGVRDLVGSREASLDQCSGAISHHLGTPVDLPFWQGKQVLVALNNTSTVAYINQQGGMHSMTFMDLTFNLFDVVLALGVTLSARHIPCRLNRTVDLLSQSRQIVNVEWTLHPQVATQLWTVWGHPMIDLMAMELTMRLLVYVSLYRDPQAHAVDTMSCTWTGMDMYVFPLWARAVSEIILGGHRHFFVLWGEGVVLTVCLRGGGVGGNLSWGGQGIYDP